MTPAPDRPGGRDLAPVLLVLSAGASARMGQAKALLPAPAGGTSEFGQTRTFLSHILDTAGEAGVATYVVVVAAPHAALIRAQTPPRPGLLFVDNQAPELGMLRSVQVGLSAVPQGTGGVLIWPVDLPAVRGDTVRAILSHAAQQGTGLIIPTHTGRGGHPLWVPARFFPALQALPPAEGLRGLRQRHPQEVAWLPVPDPFVLRDVDTPADLSALRRNPQ